MVIFLTTGSLLIILYALSHTPVFLKWKHKMVWRMGFKDTKFEKYDTVLYFGDKHTIRNISGFDIDGKPLYDIFNIDKQNITKSVKENYLHFTAKRKRKNKLNKILTKI
jgi:hypothetical protein